ncbi:MAG: hypothetical protein ACLVAW_17315 [Eisenbergiella massiliensis]
MAERQIRCPMQHTVCFAGADRAVPQEKMKTGKPPGNGKADCPCAGSQKKKPLAMFAPGKDFIGRQLGCT